MLRLRRVGWNLPLQPAVRGIDADDVVFHVTDHTGPRSQTPSAEATRNRCENYAEPTPPCRW